MFKFFGKKQPSSTGKEERITTYIPNPIDTSSVELSSDIIAIGEQLAENTHEVWSAGRTAQGWRYGEKRDDTEKLHPCLVPYSELPDSEKKYDRDTALETLKIIRMLGYKIVPISDSDEI